MPDLAAADSPLGRLQAMTVLEALCPFGHGPLRVRRVQPEATMAEAPADAVGWCVGCGVGYAAASHRHDDACAWPDFCGDDEGTVLLTVLFEGPWLAPLRTHREETSSKCDEGCCA